MLQSHIDENEQLLLARSRIPANSGHSIHMGTPRENFIKTFLEDHLSETIAIGTGEIIDSASKPGEQRNQMDIVLYKRNYPKINFGGGIHGFLAESVIATIEVKSTLDSEGLEAAMKAAQKLKGLKRTMSKLHLGGGYKPPGIQSYLVAYAGPATMDTVYGWIGGIKERLGINYPQLPVDDYDRRKIPAPALDGIFVLGKGFLVFDTSPIGFGNDEVRTALPNHYWWLKNMPSGSLMMLFMILTLAGSGSFAEPIITGPYMRVENYGDVYFFP
ncbi:MAG: hypothetical protein JWM59_1168 [Verrucomicrobiales bacterium]|nr:hypothetical protein [Verrucomicrobiales bacterium]